MKKGNLILLPIIMFLCISVVNPPCPSTALASQTPKILRLVVPSPPGKAGYPLTTLNDNLAQRFNERAKGAYKIEVHAGGALAKLPEYFDAVRVGAVEMACAPWSMFSFLDNRLLALELTFLFNNHEAASEGVVAAAPLYDEILQKKFNAKALGAFNTGFLDIFTTDKPIRTLEDWKGLMVAALSPQTATMIKDIGGAATTIMWTDHYESLQKHIVEGAIQGTRGGRTMSFPDVTRHFTRFYGVAGMNGLTINLDIWKKMPPEIQKVLLEESMVVSQWMMDLLPEIEAEDLAIFRDKGMSVYQVPPEERNRWIEATAATRAEQLAEMGDFGARIVKIAESANNKFPYKLQE